MKTCKRCHQDKPIDDFTVDTRYKDGRYPWCADCRADYRREKRHGAKRDETLEYFRDWKLQHLDEVRRQSREHFQQNEEARKRNREAGRVREKERWLNDPTFRDRKNRQKLRIYYESPQHRANHLANVKVNTHRRRARIRGSNTRYTQAEWRALCEQYDHRCLCCGRQEPEIQLTPDHVKPLSRGGSNDIANIQPLCRDCNGRKHARTIDYRPDRGA